MLNAWTLAASDPIDHVLPHNIIPITDDWGISNQLFMGVVAAVLVTVCFLYAASRIRVSGTGADAYITKGVFANLLETLCVFIRNEVAKPNLKHLTDKYIKYLWTVFFFILFCNLIGMIPIGAIAKVIAGLSGASKTTANQVSHWGGTATGNLSLNFPMAFCALVAIVYIGIKEGGFRHFLAHFSPGPGYMAPLLVPLEILGLLVKCGVLAMRLFGTMMAGHLVLAVFISLIPAAGLAMYGIGITVVLGGAALLILELFIAMLQAFIFTFLTTLFIASFAVVEHDDHAEHHEEHAAAVAH